MKCDEVKPTCGPCRKKDKICDYTNSNHRSVDPPATNRAVSEQALNNHTLQETLNPNQRNSDALGVSNSNPVHFEPHGTSDYTWTASETDVNHLPPALLEFRPESEVIPNESPEAFYGDYLSPSTASLAAVRWFGLLADGVPGNDPQLSSFPGSWENPDISLDPTSCDDKIQSNSLQRATQVLDGPLGSAASHDRTDGLATECSALMEERIWQSRELIELLPTEQALFEHFVDQIGPWVGHPCYIHG